MTTMIFTPSKVNVIFMFVLLIASGITASKTNIKSKTRQTSSFISETNAFLNSYDMSNSVKVDVESLPTHAATCYKMFSRIIKNLPNFLKIAYVNHIKEYATETSCGDPNILANHIKEFYEKNTKTLGNTLTKASQEAKGGLSCFNASAVSKEIVRNSYNMELTNEEYETKFRNTVNEMAKNQSSKVITAKSALRVSNNATSNVFIQKKQRKLSLEETKELHHRLSSRIAPSFIELKTETQNKVEDELKAEKTNGDATVTEKDNLVIEEVKNSNQQNTGNKRPDPSFANNEEIGRKIIDSIVEKTNELNQSMVKCLLGVQQISFFRVLNMASSHSFIDKVFDKDAVLAQKIAAFNSNLVSDPVDQTKRESTYNGDNEHYLKDGQEIFADARKVKNIPKISPEESVYINHKKDMKVSAKIGKECFNYINKFNTVSDKILDNFINQCNQLIGLEECNYYANMFNWDVQVDLIDQLYFDNLTSALNLENKKKEANAQVGLEKANYDFLMAAVSAFSSTEEQLEEQWRTCSVQKKVNQADIDEVLAKSKKARTTNKYGLSTLLGRCDIDYSKIQQGFSSYFVDFSVKCRSKVCTATCPGCEKWDGSNVVFSDKTELDVHCCSNVCVVIVKQFLDVNGNNTEHIGAEWFHLFSDEQSQPLTPLNLIRLKAAHKKFLEERDIQNDETIKATNSQDPSKYFDNVSDLAVDPNLEQKFNIKIKDFRYKSYFPNDYLLQKLGTILSHGEINSSRTISSISNKFNLLETLNLKIGGKTLEDFINENLILSKKGGFISCFKGSCLSQCESNKCGLQKLETNEDISTMIDPPDSRKTLTSSLFFDKDSMFVKGEDKYGEFQTGVKLSDTKYQDQCIANKDKLHWNSGYDLKRIQFDSLASKKKTPSALEGIQTLNENELTDEQKAYYEAYQEEDTFINEFLYGKNLSVDDVVSIAENSNYSMKGIFTAYTPFYLKSSESIIRTSLITKSKMNLGKYSPNYLRASIPKFYNLADGELTSQFDPDDWKPSYIKTTDKSKRLKYNNINIQNFEIDVQCDEVFCVFAITDNLKGTDYLDFIQKSVPMYDPNKMTFENKKCFAKKILNFKQLNPLYHKMDDKVNTFSEFITNDNPFKDKQTLDNNTKDNQYIVNPNEVKLEPKDNMEIKITSFIAKKVSLMNTSELKAKFNAAKAMKERIKNKEKARIQAKLKNTKVEVLQADTSKPKLVDESEFMFRVDSDCEYQNSPYTLFPIKPSCLREISSTCSESEFYRSIERFDSKPNNCPNISGCSNLTDTSKEEEFALCGELLNEMFFSQDRVNIQYKTLLSPCDTNKLIPPYQLQQQREAENSISYDEFTNEEIIFASIVSKLIEDNAPKKMTIDGSTESSTSSDLSLGAHISVGGVSNFAATNPDSSSFLTTSLIALGMMVALLLA